MMEDKAFNLVQDRLVCMADSSRKMDLEAFLHRLRLTRKGAAVLDQGLYAELDDIEAIEAVAEAAREFRKRIEAIKKDCRRRWARRTIKGESEDAFERKLLQTVKKDCLSRS